MFGSSSAIRIFAHRASIGAAQRGAAARRRQRQREREAGAAARRGCSTHSRPPKCSTIWRLMCRPRPVPCGLSVSVSPRLAELVEDHAPGRSRRCRGRCRARRPAAPRLLPRSATSTRPLRAVAELRRVRQQVEQHLDHPVEVGAHRRHPLRQLQRRPATFALLEHLAHRRRACRRSTSLRSTRRSCHSAWPDSILARSSTWLISRVSRSVSLMMMPRNFWRCSGSSVGIVEQDLGERADRSERRAQLVRHGRDEVVLQPVELLSAARWPRAARRSPPRARATSARARGCRRRTCDASSRMSQHLLERRAPLP